MKKYGQYSFSAAVEHQGSEPSSDRCLTNLADVADVHPQESELNYPYHPRSAA